MANTLPNDVMALIENFIRDMTEKKCAVFGLVYRTKPEPGIAMMRNTKDDPVRLLEIATDFVREAQDEGRIIVVPIDPIQ